MEQVKQVSDFTRKQPAFEFCKMPNVAAKNVDLCIVPPVRCNGERIVLNGVANIDALALRPQRHAAGAGEEVYTNHAALQHKASWLHKLAVWQMLAACCGTQPAGGAKVSAEEC